MLIVVVDRSVPGSLQREAQLSLLDSLAKSAAEAHYRFELWSYDASATKLSGPSFLDSVDDLDSIENKQLAHTSGISDRIARPDLALKAIVQELQKRNLNGGRIVILTDGYLMSSSDASLTSSAAPLAQLTHWRVSVLGIVPNNRSRWSKALSPELGNRFDLVEGPAAGKLLQQNRDE